MTKHPIFIHSMFRAGSTYLFQVFRRVPGPGYWCYQEPLHELFGDFGEHIDASIELTSSQNSLLRHPALDKPYLAEFIPLAEKISHAYRQSFPYADYFDNQEPATTELRKYLSMLSEEAPARPVIQCCRTTARLPSLRGDFPATHIFLWRNPWDQWWSYKVVPYFDTANLLILGSHSAIPVIRQLRTQLGIAIIPDHISTQEAFARSGERLLSSADSYRVFYSLWLIALQHGFAYADIQLSIDALSVSGNYRQNVLSNLHKFGIRDIDFTDCNIPRSIYSSRDRDFFQAIEAEIEALFASHHEDISALQHPDVMHARAEMLGDKLPTIDRWHSVGSDLSRMRELIVQSESFRKHAQQHIIDMRFELQHTEAQLQHTEAQLQSIYRSLPWRIISPFLKSYWHLRAIWRRYQAKRQTS